ncbi:type VI secretion system accessory protein TagJ [Paraburkholderia caffeinilytica]|uniref:type VI secretion system accessory protein TagJ n=1 Tax=Paraburkholderia caffeinilytica TaxID=1761016 RepID=UPI0038BBCD20
MSTSSVIGNPQTLLVNGQLSEALRALSAEVRIQPANAALRVFLFQLLAVLGDWERAANQLEVAGELDPQNALMMSIYDVALRGERQREAVMAGKASPAMYGEPAVWHTSLLQSLQALRAGKFEQALELRISAFHAAGTVAGTIDGEPFKWIADVDPRFGPCLELILETGYAWVPFSQLRSLKFEAPADLRDKVWAPVQIVWKGGSEAIGFVPCRYPGSDRSGVAGFALATRTTWIEQATDCFVGRGQRMFVTDATDYSLLDVRSVTFGEPSAG